MTNNNLNWILLRIGLVAFILYMMFAQPYLTEGQFEFGGKFILAISAIIGFRAFANSKLVTGE